jgi:hypothetical protein
LQGTCLKLGTSQAVEAFIHFKQELLALLSVAPTIHIPTQGDTGKCTPTKANDIDGKVWSDGRIKCKLRTIILHITHSEALFKHIQEGFLCVFENAWTVKLSGEFVRTAFVVEIDMLCSWPNLTSPHINFFVVF